jgi:FkbM family methyltransferase
MSFVDVGAHIGYFTVLAARSVGPGGKGWSFEAMPQSHSLLARNLCENGVSGVVEAIPKAVTDRVGYARVYPHRIYLSRSSLYVNDDMKIEEGILVETTSLDVFFEERGWPGVDLIKMDIEGSELKAIKGMRELVGRNRNVRLIVEFNPSTMGAAGVEAMEFIALLGDIGFRRLVALGCSKELRFPEDLDWLQEYARTSDGNLLCEIPAVG